VKVGFALIPDDPGALVAAQRDVAARFDLRPTLGLQANLPHVTLLQVWLRDGVDLQGVLEQLSAAPHTLMLGDVSARAPGWVFLDVVRTDALMDLHLELLALLEPALIPGTPGQASGWETYTPSERQTFLRYGSRSVGPAYAPHITLGRNQEADPAALISAFVAALPRHGVRHDVGVSWLTAYRKGPDGCHAETLARHPIPDQR
jgi:hypothetical protein